MLGLGSSSLSFGFVENNSPLFQCLGLRSEMLTLMMAFCLGLVGGLVVFLCMYGGVFLGGGSGFLFCLFSVDLVWVLLWLFCWLVWFLVSFSLFA